MDSKRVYRKVSTIFWFLLAMAPVFYSLVAVIFQWFAHLPENSNLQLQSSDTLLTYYHNFFDYFNNGVLLLGNYTPSWIFDWSEELCDVIGVGYQVGYFIAWFIWVYFIELICDVMVWLPKFAHHLLDRSVNKCD